MKPSELTTWLLAVGCICLTLTGFGGEPLIWFNQPATNWTEALPLGRVAPSKFIPKTFPNTWRKCAG